MSRLIKTDGAGKQRTQLMKALTLALRNLATRAQFDTEARDLAAFLVLALRGIHATIDVTCAAWEKRDYWLKADQFRREWDWARRTADKLTPIVQREEWHNLPLVMVELSKYVAKVELPKRNTLGTPWVGAYGKLRDTESVRQ